LSGNRRTPTSVGMEQKRAAMGGIEDIFGIKRTSLAGQTALYGGQLRVSLFGPRVRQVLLSRCQVKNNGDPQNGDPGSLFYWGSGDPGPHYTSILGIPDAQYHGDFGDPY
jgi:hypothetical protein